MDKNKIGLIIIAVLVVLLGLSLAGKLPDFRSAEQKKADEKALFCANNPTAAGCVPSGG